MPRLPRRPPLAAAVALLLVAAVAASSCAGDGDARADATSPPRPTTAAPPTDPPAPSSTTTTVPNGFPDAWRPAPLRWRSCDIAAGARCATLTVPLDWSAPAGATVDLALARLPATGDRIGSVLVNPGGPGGSGLDLLESDPFDATVARRFDVVSWDPRGVGRSTAVRCGGRTVGPFLRADPDPDTPQEEATLEQRADAVARDCGATDGALLPHLGTDDVARDLEAIRRALGDEPLNYVGFSYGTQIGQQYAAFFPDRIRTMVLDGVVDPELSFTDFLLGQVRGFDQAFAGNVTACRRAGEHRCGVADLAAAYDEVRDQVERTPIPAGHGHHIGPSELAVAATYVAYGSDGWRDLGPALADALDDHDGSRLWDLAEGYYDLGGYGAYAAVVCTDTPPPLGAAAWQAFSDEARRVSPRFGGSVANELLPCATWPYRSTHVPAAITAPGAPPILVVGNTADPATPYSNAVAVADHLRSGVLVTAAIDGHTAYGVDDCVTRLVDRYLVGRTVPADGTRCG